MSIKMTLEQLGKALEAGGVRAEIAKGYEHVTINGRTQSDHNPTAREGVFCWSDRQPAALHGNLLNLINQHYVQLHGDRVYPYEGLLVLTLQHGAADVTHAVQDLWPILSREQKLAYWDIAPAIEEAEDFKAQFVHQAPEG